MTIRWSYALNQWKGTAHDRFVLRREHERALKTVSVAAFEGVEITAGTGRWEPLGRRDTMALHYGSVRKVRDLLDECGIAAVSSWFYNPGERMIEEGSLGRSALNRGDHDGIVTSLSQYAEMLPELGGDTLVVRPLPSWAADREPTRERLAVAADCWNRAGAMAAEGGVALALHVDCTSMLRTADDIAALLDLCDPDAVGLSIDTAEATVMGLDPVALYRRFADRVRHVQFKDTRYTDTLDEYRLPNPDQAMMMAGGARAIERWFFEMGTDGGLVDLPAMYGALIEGGYDRWIVVESDQSPEPATSVLLNGWYRSRVLQA